MSKLTKPQAKAHALACDLLAKDQLTIDDKWTVLENWQESATHINSVAGAFFTPPGLARDFAIDVGGRRIIDLCAGIGTLAFMFLKKALWGEREPSEIVCVERNPDYIGVGRKILPEATWIEGDVFALPDLGRFDTAISNPPFGATKRSGNAPRFSGKEFEYHLIDIASDVADYGVFIIPQMSAPFRLSGQRHFERREGDNYKAFSERTQIELSNGCGVDTACYSDEWHGVSPTVEIVLADFLEARALRAALQAKATPQADLFAEAAE